MRPSSSASRPTGWSSSAATSRSERATPLADRLQIKQPQRRPEKNPKHLEDDAGQGPQHLDALVERGMLRRVARTRYGDEAHCAPEFKGPGTDRCLYVDGGGVKDRERSRCAAVSTS